MEHKLRTFHDVSTILLDAISSYEYPEGGVLDELGPLSQINIFVGANNSGKSRLIRELARQHVYRVRLRDWIDTVAEITRLHNVIRDILHPWGLRTYGHFDVDRMVEIERILGAADFTLSTDPIERVRSITVQWTINPDSETNPGLPSPEIRRQLFEQIIDPIRKVQSLIEQIHTFSLATFPRRVYIPTLRGLRKIGSSDEDHFLEATKTAYFSAATPAGEEKPLEIYTGLAFFKRLRSLRLGKTADRRAVEGYENFLSHTFFEGQTVELVPSEVEEVVSIKLGKDAEQPIHHLGDGVQHAIILSFLPYVMRDEPAFFFIEEPEMSMHPGLQRKLLDFLAGQPLHKYFLTSHSNHLLDLTADVKSVSVFTLSRSTIPDEAEEVTPTFAVQSVNTGCHSSLELLGVRNSSVFLVNSTIWVEGVTDRLYFRKMLEQYMALPQRQKFEEDTHYCFVEYGGSNIIHWSFLERESPQIEVERLCAKALLIVDQDGGTKLDRKAQIKAKLGDDRFIEIEGREIENMLSYDVIRKVVSIYEKDDKIALLNCEFESYRDQYMGNFIQTTMLKDNPKRRGGYKEASGTVKDKLGFCERALPLIKFDNLPQPTKEIVTKIYNFIADQNRR